MRQIRHRTGFDRLLSPGRIGPIELTSRVVLPAMDMNLCEDGVITDGEIAHYTARAAGGTAMIITGSAAVAFPRGAAAHNQPGLSEDRFIPGVRRLADSVHAAGSLLCLQLCHHGKTARVDVADGRPLLVVSVPTPNDMSALIDNTPDELAKLAATTGGKKATYKVAEEDDLAWVIDQFAAAARRVREAGADAVEIHAAHGYLLSTFLSSADNKRTDRWGGSLENRARLTVEVISAVKAAVGDDMAVLVRVSGKEFGGPGSLTTEEAVAASVMFEAAGADAIHVTAYGRNSFSNFTDGPLPDTIGSYRSYARAVKAAVKIPVIAVGRILPEVAEEMLAAGDCDFVSMGRQQLADPTIVNNLRAGRRESIRPCINCYVCVEQNFWDSPPKCAVNPALCNEPAGRWDPVASPRHVVVIGGGPGGMEAARIARTRGHRVTLVESGDRLGGTAWFSQMTTPANGPLIDWQAHELDRLGVVVKLGSRATAESVKAMRPDVVVVATGAKRGRPDVPGADLPHVQDGDGLRSLMTGTPSSTVKAGSILRLAMWFGKKLRLTTKANRVRALSKRYMPVGKQVVVVGGSLVGLELAEFLAERRRTVTVLESGGHLGLPMAAPRRWTAVRRASEHSVTLVRRAELVEITGTDVAYRVGEELVRIPADTVIVASHVDPGGALATELQAGGIEAHAIGDAAEVGYIEGAIHSAWRTATTL